MYLLKVVTTLLIVLMVLIIVWSGKEYRWERDKSNMIGFGFMELVHLLSLICIWL